MAVLTITMAVVSVPIIKMSSGRGDFLSFD